MRCKIIYPSARLWIFLWALPAIFLSCRVTYLPSYDAEISEKIYEVARQVDRFYLLMQENSERNYRFYAEEYINIEAELNSLYLRNKVRPLNENSTRICEITLQLWQKYKDEHKTDKTVSDGLIKLNRKTFSDLFYAMQVAEKGKDMVSNPPE